MLSISLVINMIAFSKTDFDKTAKITFLIEMIILGILSLNISFIFNFNCYSFDVVYTALFKCSIQTVLQKTISVISSVGICYFTALFCNTLLNRKKNSNT